MNNSPSLARMRVKLRVVAALLALCSLVAPNATYGQFTYKTNNGAITITRYTGTDSNLVIPSVINGLPVTTIGTFAFDNQTTVTNVTIPASVTTVERQAFWNCVNLRAITIPSSVTNIGSYVFEACTNLPAINVDPLNANYRSDDGILFNRDQTTLIFCPRGKSGGVIIPGTVTNLESFAFGFCQQLTNITIPESLATLSYYAFNACTGLRSVTIPATVRSIGAFTFAACNGLSTVTIPDGVTNIDERAFAFCANLTNVAISPGVRTIGVDAFNYCEKLIAITVDSLNPAYRSMDGVLFDHAGVTLIQCPGGKSGSYIIPDGVASIGDEAFSWCTSLRSVVIPDSVTRMGSWAFSDCTNLTNVSIGNGVAGLGLAFPECTSLTTVTIGRGVTSVSGQTFWRCYNLAAVYFQGDAPLFGGDVFLEDQLATVYYLPGTIGWDFAYTGGRPSAPWSLPNPLILNFGPAFGVQSNAFGFRISWATNASVVVDACTNLAASTWLPLKTNALVNGWTDFSDSQWLNHPNRIYRVRQQ